MRDLTNTPYKQFIWFIAEIVEAITDTDRLGRVRIRVLGFHSEDTPNDKLPLALVMNGGAARLVEKQWVVGFFLDGALAQQPFVLGTVGSAIGNPAKVNSKENAGPNQDTSKGTLESLLADVEAAKQKLRRAINAGGDVIAAKKELDDAEARLKAAFPIPTNPANPDPPIGDALASVVGTPPPVAQGKETLNQLRNWFIQNGTIPDENPLFPGDYNSTAHKSSEHGEGRAFDVNIGKGNVEWNNPAQKAKFDSMEAALKQQGWKVVWNSTDHADHLHVYAPSGSPETPPIKFGTGS